jgi:hypothetical protein
MYIYASRDPNDRQTNRRERKGDVAARFSCTKEEHEETEETEEEMDDEDVVVVVRN